MPAQDKASAPDFLTGDELSAEAEAAQWQTVSEEDVEEGKFTFDIMGDQFMGTYHSLRIVDGAEGKFTQYRFERDGSMYFINAGWSLQQGMSKVRKGQQVRITWTGERDTGQPTPMRVFRVDVAKRPIQITGKP